MPRGMRPHVRGGDVSIIYWNIEPLPLRQLKRRSFREEPSMTEFNRLHMLHTEGDGELTGKTSIADIDEMVAKAAEIGHMVIHMHGGLVDESKAIDLGTRLIPQYIGSGTYPIILVWKSGLLETVTENWKEIFDENIFQLLLKKVTKWAVGKLGKQFGTKAIGSLVTPSDLDVSIEINKRRAGSTPYESLRIDSNPKELSQEEEEAFLGELKSDPDLEQELAAILAGITPGHENKTVGRKGIVTSHRVSARSLMSPDVLEELKADKKHEGEKGLMSSASFLIHAGKVLYRVVRRFIDGRQHVGLYTTIVEEIYREFYMANIGACVWNMMKNDTKDAYENVGGSPVRGGWYLMNAIGAKMKEKPFKVSVVCHSTGAIYVCHLLNYAVSAMRSNKVPTTFRLENLIFLAPAVDFRLFAATLTNARQLVANFRMFALREEEETNYWEVPVLYKGSLLYMISGLLEKEPGDTETSAFDRPIVGMQRYFSKESVYRQEEVQVVKKFIQNQQNGAIWSVTLDGPVDCRADTKKHGEFDDTAAESHVTMESVFALLAKS